MLRKLIILPLLFVAIHAAGEFSILNAPKSLDFKATNNLPSEIVGDVISASLGHSVQSNSKWELYVNDPFNVAKSAIVVEVSGVKHIATESKAKTYEVDGNSENEALNNLAVDLVETSSSPVIVLDFNQAVDDALVTFSEQFGEVPAPKVKATGALKPELHSEDKHFLKQIAYIDAVSAKIATLKDQPCLLAVRLSLTPIANAHGEKSAAVADAQKLLSAAIENLLTSAKQIDSDVLFVVIASKIEGSASRTKRQAEPTTDTDKLNLAIYYNEDYPVIFNIILWFMVIFGLSLLAISYAIAAMDPGRDSIIYRMTSTRMKKDN